MHGRAEGRNRSVGWRRRAAAPVLIWMVGILVVTSACSARMIPQPDVPPDLEVAPEADRVDLAVPTFSHPTEITNPLFPVSDQASVLMLGEVDGLPFRTEVLGLVKAQMTIQ